MDVLPKPEITTTSMFHPDEGFEKWSDLEAFCAAAREITDKMSVGSPSAGWHSFFWRFQQHAVSR